MSFETWMASIANSESLSLDLSLDLICREHRPHELPAEAEAEAVVLPAKHVPDTKFVGGFEGNYVRSSIVRIAAGRLSKMPCVAATCLQADTSAFFGGLTSLVRSRSWWRTGPSRMSSTGDMLSLPGRGMLQVGEPQKDVSGAVRAEHCEVASGFGASDAPLTAENYGKGRALLSCALLASPPAPEMQSTRPV